MAKTSPNIVIIHVDQWRADCLSIDGHAVVHTPTLDQLALQGVRFSSAYAACPTCVPARASLMTGLTPVNHGRVGYCDGIAWEYETTLAGEFSQQGYRTHAVGKMHVYPERNPLGFQSVELHDGFLHFARKRKDNPDLDDDYVVWLREQTGRQDADYFEHGVSCNSVVARPWPLEERLHPTNWVATRGIDFLSKHDSEDPFFLYLSFHRPHPPYDPPAWAFEQYLNMEMPDPPVGDWADLFLKEESSHNVDAFRARFRPDVMQRARAGYYGHMTHIDHQINRIVESLNEYGFGQDTWIIFTSDHGEMMGDHHLFRKGFPYEGSARLPMILKAPSARDFPRGQVCDTTLELRDIMPTLLDCAGLEIPENIDGKSFLAQAEQRSDAPLRAWIHGEHTMFDGSMQWLTDGREKYIWHSAGGEEQLFDLKSDPNELHDLAASDDPGSQKRLAYWRAAMVEELMGREEGFVDDSGLLVAGRPVQPVLASLR
ncbi:arylsulfatase [Coraliomargarita algicola]|uniref:Arylsulfatase n=1 Tax=Coraliomargarita algicola TaxID=3092156 RepID=A0ABZ0RKX0_9BACT|nr:arylsulfatase [Coraliomargarita sp. J2-16]WPJ96707.1 arylsulfatase [Coraliomargarita sp. J2-16]